MRCTFSSSTVLMNSGPVRIATCCTYCTIDWNSSRRSSFRLFTNDSVSRVHGDELPPDAQAHQIAERASRALQQVGEAVSHSNAGVMAGAAVAGWVVLGTIPGFPSWWATVLYAWPTWTSPSGSTR